MHTTTRAALPVQAPLRPSTEAPARGMAAPDPIVTTTDLDGRIGFANSAFLRASGYAQREVLGQPHSLVRHPDMPAAVFADLWQSLRRGQAWSGIVLNRGRDAQHWWVKANVIPIVDSGSVVGYTSVQLPADPQDVQQAERVYRLWRQGGGRHYRLRAGRIVETGWPAVWHSLSHPFDLPVQHRVHLTAGLLVLLFALALAAAAAPAALASWLAGHGGWQAWAAGGAALGMVVSGCLAWYFQSRILRPLRASLATARHVAGGDVFRPFDDGPGAGELRDLNQALGQMVAKMAAVLKDVHNHAGAVDAAIDGLATGTQQLAARSTHQAGAVRGVEASTARIAALLRENAQSTDAACAAVLAVESAALEGAQRSARLLEAMQAIVRQDDDIAEIARLVDDVAQQTNILALNAATEAARAGDRGRGFSVVAAEVRSLALRSREAAEDIRRLVEASRALVAQGQSLATASSTGMAGITQEAHRAGSTLAEITRRAGDQSRAVDDIHRRVRELDGATGQNAALAERSAGVFADIAREARQLNAAVGIFRL